MCLPVTYSSDKDFPDDTRTEATTDDQTVTAGLPDAPIHTTGVDHITLIGSNEEETIAFYRDLLGMPPVLRQPNLDDPASTHLFFDTGDGRILTFFVNDRESDPRSAGGQVGSVHHVSFRIDPERFVEVREAARDCVETYIALESVAGSSTIIKMVRGDRPIPTVRSSCPCAGGSLDLLRLEIVGYNAKAGLRLVFWDEKVVKHSGDKNEDFLTDILETDEGARYLGELGIGMNRDIDRFTRNTLFDEKMGDTVHMTVGRAYPDTVGEDNEQNDSAVHVDMILDMSEDSYIELDGEVVQRNGTFWFEDGFEG